MPNQLTFAVPLQGALITGAKIVRGDEVHMSNGRIVIVVELFGDLGVTEVVGVTAHAAVPEQLFVAATDTTPEIPYLPEIPAVVGVTAVPGIKPIVHPTNFHLEVTNTISDTIQLDTRSVDGVKIVRKAIPNAFSFIMGSGFQAAAAGGSAEDGMLTVMKQLGILPAGTIG